jgi:hypothetical protein
MFVCVRACLRACVGKMVNMGVLKHSINVKRLRCVMSLKLSIVKSAVVKVWDAKTCV